MGRRTRRLALVTTAWLVLATPAAVQARAPASSDLEAAVERIVEVERVVVEAERAAANTGLEGDTDLAKRLVAGQLKLEESDFEGAAIVFLDLLQNHPQSPAATQAVYHLGEALLHLGMERWAGELFSRNLRDASAEARRFHQRSVARLLELAAPRRTTGFARQPGPSATPETRARLNAMGLSTQLEPPKGSIGADDEARLARWAVSFPAADRIPELRYALGRYLYLRGEHERARQELDPLSPIDLPLTKGGPGAEWRVRAAYVAAAATLALADFDDALERFSRITSARPSEPRDRQIVELAWMAIGRIEHDLGHHSAAVRAYRRVGRDSPFFPEAMYETAWTLLSKGRFDRAREALDRLLAYHPSSPIVSEIKQLRGKVRIQQRQYEEAENDFRVLHAEYEELKGQVAGRLHAEGEASRYFAAVVAEDMENFGLGSVLPARAIPLARGLPRTTQAVDLAREVGRVTAELHETRALLARMEDAIESNQRARVFRDLGAHVASLDTADKDVLEVKEDLVRRLGARLRGQTRNRLEAQAKKLRARLDEPAGERDGDSKSMAVRLRRLDEQALGLERAIGAQRAQLVATERSYQEARGGKSIDRAAFLAQAAELRETIAAQENDLARLRERIERTEGRMRFHDPSRAARDRAAAAYRSHLAHMYDSYSKVSRDPESDELWRRTDALEQRLARARLALDRTAIVRLRHARRVLVEERANLDAYLVELGAKRNATKSLVAEVMEASSRDVVEEIDALIIRSEVGLLDVAWSKKAVEEAEARRLETQRDRDVGDIEEAVQMGLEDLQR